MKKIIKSKLKSKQPKSNKFDVVCIGGVTQDIFFYSDQLQEIDNPKRDPNCLKLITAELSAKINGKKMMRTWGGGAGNTAMNFNKLGLKTALISAVGQESFGVTAKEHFINNKIDCRYLKLIKGQETALSFLLSNANTGNHTVFTYDGAKKDLSLKLDDLKKLKPTWIYVSSLSENWRSVFKPILAYLKMSKCKLVWNPGAIQLQAGVENLKPYISLCEILILNRDEVVGLVANGKSFSANELLEKLGSVGAKINVMTDGPAGVFVTVDKQRYFEPAMSNLKPLNTTGAGDAFGSTLVSALHKGESLQMAMRYAIRQSSNILKVIGAQSGLKSWKEITR